MDERGHLEVDALRQRDGQTGKERNAAVPLAVIPAGISAGITASGASCIEPRRIILSVIPCSFRP